MKNNQVFLSRFVCHCGHVHVYRVCPRCGLDRTESVVFSGSVRRPVLVGVGGLL